MRYADLRPADRLASSMVGGGEVSEVTATFRETSSSSQNAVPLVWVTLPVGAAPVCHSCGPTF